MQTFNFVVISQYSGRWPHGHGCLVVPLQVGKNVRQDRCLFLRQRMHSMSQQQKSGRTASDPAVIVIISLVGSDSDIRGLSYQLKQAVRMLLRVCVRVCNI